MRYNHNRTELHFDIALCAGRAQAMSLVFTTSPRVDLLIIPQPFPPVSVAPTRCVTRVPPIHPSLATSTAPSHSSNPTPVVLPLSSLQRPHSYPLWPTAPTVSEPESPLSEPR